MPNKTRKRLTDSKLLTTREEITTILARYDRNITTRLNDGLTNLAEDLDRELKKVTTTIEDLEADVERYTTLFVRAFILNGIVLVGLILVALFVAFG